MFNDARNQLYHIPEPSNPAGQASRYVGKTDRSPGIRVLEHLRAGRDRVHPELAQAQRENRLDQLQVQQGHLLRPDHGRLTHLAEVTLQELHQSDWNDARKHGLDDEALEW